MAGGRPTKYRKEYCDLLVKHMTLGYSFESFAADCKVNVDTLHEWCKRHPEFSDSKKLGSAASRKYWETIGKGGMTGKIPGFIASIWIFNMKNRFGWRDSQEIHNSDSGEVKKIEVSYKLD